MQVSPVMPEDRARAPLAAQSLEDAAFRLLVASVVDYAIFMLDTRGNVVSWNRGAERIKGYSEAEIVGHNFARFYLEEDQRSGKPATELEVAARDGRCEDEGWRVRKDGSRFWAQVIIAALRDERGALVGFGKVTRDLTERRRAEEQRLETAMKAARVLEGMGELSVGLAKARTVSEVATVVADRATAIAGADTCFVYMLDDPGTALELVGHRGLAREVVEASLRLTEETAPESFAALHGGASVWAESAQEYTRLFPRVATLMATGPRARAFWCTPLLVESRAIGLFGMGFYEERHFTMEDRSVADTLAKQCAQALLRSRRLEIEERAKAWLGTTLRSIGDAVMATDTTGRITFMNAVAERLTGWSEGEAIARSLDEVFCILSEQTRAIVESPVTKVLREGHVVGLANHTVLRPKRGPEVPIDDSAAPIRDADGNIFGVVLVFRDATSERRALVRREFLERAGAALASSLDYRATLASVALLAVPQLADWCTVDIVEPGSAVPQQLALAHVDPDKVRWARMLAEKYPADPDAKTGAPNVIRTGKSELYPEIAGAMLEAAARDEEHRRIIRALRLESAMVVPLRGHDRNLGAMTFIYADSARRYNEDDVAFAEEFARRAALAIENARAMKEAEEARAQERRLRLEAEAARAEERRLRAEADMANRAKDEFLATVSHELRTPLNAILGWTVSLRGRTHTPETDRALVIIERNARRQIRLIEDILDVSRIISGKMTLTPGPTNLAEVVDGAVEAVFAAAQAKSVAIDVDTDRALTITADTDRLYQIVWNLLANAVKFSPKGGEVLVRAHREGSDVGILVKDAGEGIAPEVLPHVFEPFRQADASTTRKHGGLGLGLAITKQLVTAHGGTVEARSEGPGRGAEFLVRIPARSALQAVAEPPREGSTAGRQPVAGSAVSPRLDGLSVLVVDDEEDARLIIEHVLREQGAEVLSAQSAEEALEIFAAVRPDVIVCDIGMPVTDGYSLLRRVRALPANKGGRTPALALTAYARREDAQRAFAAGFQMHVPKPVEPRELATLVGNLGGRTLN